MAWETNAIGQVNVPGIGWTYNVPSTPANPATPAAPAIPPVGSTPSYSGGMGNSGSRGSSGGSSGGSNSSSGGYSGGSQDYRSNPNWIGNLFPGATYNNRQITAPGLSSPLIEGRDFYIENGRAYALPGLSQETSRQNQNSLLSGKVQNSNNVGNNNTIPWVPNQKGQFTYKDKYGITHTTSDLHTALTYGRGDITNASGKVVAQGTGYHYLPGGRVMSDDEFWGRNQGQIEMPYPSQFSSPEEFQKAYQEYETKMLSGDYLREGFTRPTPGISRSTDVWETRFVPDEYGNIWVEYLGSPSTTGPQEVKARFWAATNPNWRKGDLDTSPGGYGQLYSRQMSPFEAVTIQDRDLSGPPSGYSEGANDKWIQDILAKAKTYQYVPSDTEHWYIDAEGNYKWRSQTPAEQRQLMASVAGARNLSLSGAKKDEESQIAPLAAVTRRVPGQANDEKSQQELLAYYRDNPEAGYMAIEQLVPLYQERQAKGDVAGAEELHNWANEIRDAMGVSHLYDRKTGAYLGQEEIPPSTAAIPAVYKEESAPVNFLSALREQIPQAPELVLPKREDFIPIATQMVDAQYNNKLKRTLDTVAEDQIRRGFFGQLPAAAITAQAAKDVEVERADTINNLATQLWQDAVKNAQTNYQLQLQNRETEANILNDLINQWWKGLEEQRAREQMEAEYTGIYNGQPTLKAREVEAAIANEKNQDVREEKQLALDIWKTEGTANENVAKILGVKPGTKYWEVAAKERDQALDAYKASRSSSGSSSEGGYVPSTVGERSDYATAIALQRANDYYDGLVGKKKYPLYYTISSLLNDPKQQAMLKRDNVDVKYVVDSLIRSKLRMTPEEYFNTQTGSKLKSSYESMTGKSSQNKSLTLADLSK